MLAYVGYRYYKKRNKKQLTDKTVVLITGACQGIGRELALKFATLHKCIIVAWDHRHDLAPQLLQDIEKAGGDGHFVECDISKRNDVHRALAETLAKFNFIDILVNNAGIVHGKSFENLTNEEFEHTFGVNLFGPVWLMKEILNLMKKENRGHIVNICSTAALLYSCDSGDYCASKAALFAVHSALRLELKREKSKIDTTIVCPSGIATKMFEGFSTRPILKPFFKFLAPERAAQKIYDGIVLRDEEVFFPYYHQLAFRLAVMLPTFIVDYIGLYLSGKAFANFKGRRNLQEKKNQ